MLVSGGRWEFIYFVGENNGRRSIPANLEIKNLSTGATIKRQLDLPINAPSPILEIEPEWFATKESA